MTPWFDLEDPNQYLYHYTTRQAALGSILPAASIRLGLVRYMNDPRESKAWRFTLEGEAGPATRDLLAVSQRATALAKSTAKVLALTRDAPSGAGEGFGQYGRGFAHSAMWAHYGGGHSGVCLVFEKARMGEEIDRALRPKGNLYAGNVEYDDARSDEIDAFTLRAEEIEHSGLETVVEEHIQLWHPVLFFRKSREWENEREYRWLLRSPEPVPVVVSIRDSLCGIVLGHDFPVGDHDAVDYLAKSYTDISVATCTWHNGVPQVIPRGGPPGIAIDGRFWTDGAKRPPPPPSLEIDPTHS
jgi:hypothetical protein